MFYFLNNCKNVFKFSKRINEKSFFKIWSVRFFKSDRDILNVKVTTGILGKITSFDENHNRGKIDERIYFDSSSNILFSNSNKSMKVGCDVLVNATKNPMNNKWFAITVEVLKNPENIFHIPEALADNLDTKHDSSTKLIGTVTSSANNCISIDNSIKYTFKKNDCDNFCPIKGDLVVAVVDHSNMSNRIISISPLKIIDFEGIITSFEKNIGFINNEIYFRKSINVNLDFKCGLKIYGKAIESVRRRYKMRAINIFKMDENRINANQSIEKDNLINLTTKKFVDNVSQKLKFNIPNELELEVKNNENLIKSYPILTEALTPLNYMEKMRLLLFLEEIATKETLKQFFLENMILIRKFDLFKIEIHDLKENSFKLNIGDGIKIKPNKGDFSIENGLIVDIVLNAIFVKVNSKFYRNYSDEKCTIFFEHTRVPYIRMHLGIDIGTKLINEGITFPEEISIKPSQLIELNTNENIIDWKFFNQSLNEIQKLAVLRILQGVCRPLPYILFGPPGTGKTVTLVETVLQVLKNIPTSRILLCSPSNNVADSLCLKLHKTGVINKVEMARVISNHKWNLLNTLENHSEMKSYLEVAEESPNLLSKRIIITTCNSSALLYFISKIPEHFTHVFIDEASQASEPEIMIPIGLLSLNHGQILLTGDPMQLGPVILSKHSKPLKGSYLQRLLYSCKIYQTQPEVDSKDLNNFNPLLVTQLIHNYRSHPVLLKLPSDLFYNSKLIACANETKFLNWKWLPNPEFPLIFHKVSGNESRLTKGGSVYNIDEAKLVVTWIKRLLEGDATGKQIKPANINVITPYRAQVNCIKNLLNVSFNESNNNKLKVASVEEFQGQENDVIIISTVRSSVGVGVDNYTLKSRLGFLSSGQRFNVSITRAKSLLIVVGDPELLIHDKFWCDLIMYAEINGASI